MQISIREKFALLDEKNPISGHQWTSHGPTTSWEVVGPTGVLSTHRSEAKAEESKAAWQDYFDRLNR